MNTKKSKSESFQSSFSSEWAKDQTMLDCLLIAFLQTNYRDKLPGKGRKNKGMIVERFRNVTSRSISEATRGRHMDMVFKAGFDKLLQDAPKSVQDAYDKLIHRNPAKTLQDIPSAFWLGGKGRSPTLRRVSVVDTGFNDWDARTENARFQKFSELVAPHLVDVLARARHVALAWGRSLAEPIEALKSCKLDHLRRRRYPLTIAATCGEIIGTHHRGHSSSYLAMKLSEIVYGDKFADHALTFFGVGAIVPRDWIPGPEQSNRAKGHVSAYFNLCEGYKRMFSQVPADHSKIPSPFVKHVDTLLTSVSVDGGLPKMFGEELVNVGGFDSIKVKEASVGDIGGALIPLNSSGNILLHEIEKAWTGIKLADYKRVADNALTEKPSRPGVIVIAMGANKVETVLHAVRRGLVNELIIDAELASALNKAAEKLKAPMPTATM